MKPQSNLILQILNVLTWLGFIGICIEAGAILFSLIFNQTYEPKNMYSKIDLGQLKSVDVVAFYIVYICLFILIAMQGWMFYYLLQILKKVNLQNPFNTTIQKLISALSAVVFVIGIFSNVIEGFCKKYKAQNINFTSIEHYFNNGDTFIFFAGVIFLISVIFKKGIELQNETDLTI